MRFTSTIVATILAFAATGVLSAPLPQLAGEGNACDSVLTSTDNGVGYGTENAEDNTAQTVTAAKTASGSARRRRQLAGEGSACGSILTDTDSGVGYGTENAEDNTANTISSTQATAPAAGTRRRRRRQADKIANGEQAVSNAAGTGQETQPVTTEVVNIDGQSTSDASTDGAQIGSDEETTLEQAGSDAKARRQADKIANGEQAVSNAAGTGQETQPVTTEVVNIDGQSTGDASTDGAQVGQDEETTLEQAGSDTP